MASISVYAIEGIDETSDWTDAWQIAETSYGIDAICRNIFESAASVDDDTLALRVACEERTKLTEALLRERDTSATHAFAHSVEGKPVFGIHLSNLFE